MDRWSAPTLRIGELATALGLNPKPIRYYEAIGLLPAPRRSPAGYRLYDDTDRERLRFIGQAKAIGLTLEEIREILALRDVGMQPCEHVRGLLVKKLAAVEAQLRTLVEIHQELLALREETAAATQPSASVCRIIEHHRPHRQGPPAASRR